MLNKIKNLFSRKKETQKRVYTNDGEAQFSVTAANKITTDKIQVPYEWHVPKQLSDYEAVKEFHEAFDHPVAFEPTPLTLDRAYKRSKWTVEEIIETLLASCENNKEFIQQSIKLSEDVLKITQETLDKNNHEQPSDNKVDRLVGQVDGLVDALYFINGSFVEMNVNPQEIFDIVQEANMSKLGEDGKPIIRKSDGKIQKPANWKPPEPKIEAEVKKQIRDAVVIHAINSGLEFGDSENNQQ